ncbi:hypothetical protein RND81_10G194400 [Saponaria officinalis]|uniref:C2H2-type domain-containing protein n=1 Tax=Saponaria officinalis TaxID=3572 RepID=A0AAW1I6I8_SAPOF
MESPPFYVLGKRTLDQSSVLDDSWEEKAFAEDAAGIHGGCVWPPTAYFCSFCRREFRSAQALGGHMNVHRRDRAKLKQFPTPLINNQTIKNKEFCFDFQNPNAYYNYDGFWLNLKQNSSTPTAKEDEAICYKRRKVINKDEVDEHQILSEVNGIKSCSIQELDLELRLGDGGPKSSKKCLYNLFT